MLQWVTVSEENEFYTSPNTHEATSNVVNADADVCDVEHISFFFPLSKACVIAAFY